MKSFQYPALVLGSIVSCTIVFGQNAPPTAKPEPPPEKKPDAARAAEQDETENPYPIKPIVESKPGQRKAQPGYGHTAMVDRRLAAFVRLRELLFERVKLDSDKRKKIDGMFDDYMAGLLDSKQMPHTQPRIEDFATPQEIPELRKQLEEAQKGDDREKIASLKAKIYAATIALEPSVIDEPVFFFNYLMKELSEEQQKQFDPTLTRWRLLRVAEIAPDNDFKHLRRAVRDPLLTDSTELSKQLDSIIVEAMRSIELGPKRLDREVMKELAVTTKPKILEKLDPKQREHFEKTVEMLKKWELEDPGVALKTRERLKDHKPSRVNEKGMATPTKGSPTQP